MTTGDRVEDYAFTGFDYEACAASWMGREVIQMKQDGGTGLEFRHLRYLVAVADAGTFTHAAERLFVAQLTLSQQIRRLEELVGTPLLQRRRDGVRLTAAGSILLEESRTVLSRLEQGITRSRQAAGLGRPRHAAQSSPPAGASANTQQQWRDWRRLLKLRGRRAPGGCCALYRWGCRTRMPVCHRPRAGAVEVDGHQGSRRPAVTGVRCTRSSPRSRASMAMTARPMPGARSAITSV
jgi:molybdenum-dependent DNA-binding transcriptional regulator ModE